MNKTYIFIIFLLVVKLSIAQYIKLSPKTQLSVLTCSPGHYLYNTFGHSTIRITDSVHNIDYIFHYGTFDFNQKNFYWNFIKGRLNYMLAIQTFNGFFNEYKSEGRDVWEMNLNLTLYQKQQIFNYLMWKSLPENKYYLYDFFYDNCATRVRDVFIKQLKDSLLYPQKQINLTYRQAIAPYLRSRPWLRLGINILLGLPADKKLTSYSAAFLPYYLDTLIMQSEIILPNGKKQKLVINKKKIIDSNFQLGNTPFLNPNNIFYAILLIIAIISYIEIKKQKNYHWIDFTWLLLSGIIGLIILFMWFGTDHSPTKSNLNIIWALPLNAIAAFGCLKNKFTKIFGYYMRLLFVYYLLFFIFMFFSPQQYDSALYPIILLFIVRTAIFYLKPFKKFEFNL